MKKIIGIIITALVIVGIYYYVDLEKIDSFIGEIQGDEDSVLNGVFEALVEPENKITKARKEDDLLPVSVQGSFSYEKLSEEEKVVYAQILTGVTEKEEKIGVAALDNDALSKCLESVLEDHPEIFYITGDSTIWMNQNETQKELELKYNVPIEDIDEIRTQIEKRAEEVLQSLTTDMSDYDKAKYIYEYVILNTDYELESSQNQNIQSVLLNQKSVCAGYAKTFQYLMQRAGLFCAYIPGTVKFNQQEHAWNLIKLEEEYYYVDPTWGDPTYDAQDENDEDAISYDYFCLTSDEILRTHSPASMDEFVVCTNRTYDYYNVNHLFFETYIEAEVVALLKESIYRNDEEISLKFSSKEVFEQAKASLFEQEKIKEAALVKIEQDQLDKYEYQYSFNEEYYIIKIQW